MADLPDGARGLVDLSSMECALDAAAMHERGFLVPSADAARYDFPYGVLSGASEFSAMVSRSDAAFLAGAGDALLAEGVRDGLVRSESLAASEQQDDGTGPGSSARASERSDKHVQDLAAGMVFAQPRAWAFAARGRKRAARLKRKLERAAYLLSEAGNAATEDATTPASCELSVAGAATRPEHARLLAEAEQAAAGASVASEDLSRPDSDEESDGTEFDTGGVEGGLPASSSSTGASLSGDGSDSGSDAGADEEQVEVDALQDGGSPPHSRGGRDGALMPGETAGTRRPRYDEEDSEDDERWGELALAAAELAAAVKAPSEDAALAPATPADPLACPASEAPTAPVRQALTRLDAVQAALPALSLFELWCPAPTRSSFVVELDPETVECTGTYSPHYGPRHPASLPDLGRYWSGPTGEPTTFWRCSFRRRATVDRVSLVPFGPYLAVRYDVSLLRRDPLTGTLRVVARLGPVSIRHFTASHGRPISVRVPSAGGVLADAVEIRMHNYVSREHGCHTLEAVVVIGTDAATHDPLSGNTAASPATRRPRGGTREALEALLATDSSSQPCGQADDDGLPTASSSSPAAAAAAELQQELHDAMAAGHACPTLSLVLPRRLASAAMGKLVAAAADSAAEAAAARGMAALLEPRGSADRAAVARLAVQLALEGQAAEPAEVASCIAAAKAVDQSPVHLAPGPSAQPLGAAAEADAGFLGLADAVGLIPDNPAAYGGKSRPMRFAASPGLCDGATPDPDGMSVRSSTEHAFAATSSPLAAGRVWAWTMRAGAAPAAASSGVMFGVALPPVRVTRYNRTRDLMVYRPSNGKTYWAGVKLRRGRVGEAVTIAVDMRAPDRVRIFFIPGGTGAGGAISAPLHRASSGAAPAVHPCVAFYAPQRTAFVLSPLLDFPSLDAFHAWHDAYEGRLEAANARVAMSTDVAGTAAAAMRSGSLSDDDATSIASRFLPYGAGMLPARAFRGSDGASLAWQEGGDPFDGAPPFLRAPGAPLTGALDDVAGSGQPSGVSLSDCVLRCLASAERQNLGDAAADPGAATARFSGGGDGVLDALARAGRGACLADPAQPDPTKDFWGQITGPPETEEEECLEPFLSGTPLERFAHSGPALEAGCLSREGEDPLLATRGRAVAARVGPQGGRDASNAVTVSRREALIACVVAERQGIDCKGVAAAASAASAALGGGPPVELFPPRLAVDAVAAAPPTWQDGALAAQAASEAMAGRRTIVEIVSDALVSKFTLADAVHLARSELATGAALGGTHASPLSRERVGPDQLAPVKQRAGPRMTAWLSSAAGTAPATRRHRAAPACEALMLAATVRHAHPELASEVLSALEAIAAERAPQPPSDWLRIAWERAMRLRAWLKEAGERSTTAWEAVPSATAEPAIAGPWLGAQSSSAPLTQRGIDEAVAASAACFSSSSAPGQGTATGGAHASPASAAAANSAAAATLAAAAAGSTRASPAGNLVASMEGVLRSVADPAAEAHIDLEAVPADVPATPEWFAPRGPPRIRHRLCVGGGAGLRKAVCRKLRLLLLCPPAHPDADRLPRRWHAVGELGSSSAPVMLAAVRTPVPESVRQAIRAVLLPASSAQQQVPLSWIGPGSRRLERLTRDQHAADEAAALYAADARDPDDLFAEFAEAERGSVAFAVCGPASVGSRATPRSLDTGRSRASRTASSRADTSTHFSGPDATAAPGRGFGAGETVVMGIGGSGAGTGEGPAQATARDKRSSTRHAWLHEAQGGVGSAADAALSIAVAMPPVGSFVVGAVAARRSARAAARATALRGQRMLLAGVRTPEAVEAALSRVRDGLRVESKRWTMATSSCAMQARRLAEGREQAKAGGRGSGEFGQDLAAAERDARSRMDRFQTPSPEFQRHHWRRGISGATAGLQAQCAVEMTMLADAASRALECGATAGASAERVVHAAAWALALDWGPNDASVLRTARVVPALRVATLLRRGAVGQSQAHGMLLQELLTRMTLVPTAQPLERQWTAISASSQAA
ncbi:hypothetical protein FNF28_04192 [Cafeteria roenbergensis]|uniref:Uncharacterized protein n=1 Tax=Cafeteria roenbergensis TaxID=33653 RepID=A0A5A8DDW5_CAFRO|nr:hypothetical protein FNF28_04192 [Cafeteria roenbergensis]